MILQALTEYYRTMAAKGMMDALGWAKSKITFGLNIEDDGSLSQVTELRREEPRGKKLTLFPRQLTLPAPVKRSSGISSNFLWDNSSYLLGIADKGRPARILECFQACRTLHETLLEGCPSPSAQALLSFFRSWNPSAARSHPALASYLDEILAGCNLVFLYEGRFIQDDPMIRDAWDSYYCRSDGGNSPEMVCLVTGELGPVETIHPSIKNVEGAQATGAALVSFNAPAFCSYGKEQNLNAPTSKYAAFAYTSALNHLLADRERAIRFGDTTVVFWAKSGTQAYGNCFRFAALGAGPQKQDEPPKYSESDLTGAISNLAAGKPVLFEEERLDPKMEFYVLGISPNAARLSVRFFYRSSFGSFMKNAQEHQERLSIVRPAYDKQAFLSLWRLMYETVNPNARVKTPAPGMAAETLRAVLSNTPYPATLLNGVMLRIRAEHDVTRGRAAILKAYYTKSPHPDVPKEVLTMHLNPDSNHTPYLLGRLFSVLEAIQTAANPGINSTIKDKYFSSASATPATVFPVLINLAQKHLKKLDGGMRIYWEKQLTELMGRLGESFPSRMNLAMQGAFQLGYYQQTQKRYEKKEEN